MARALDLVSRKATYAHCAPVQGTQCASASDPRRPTVSRILNFLAKFRPTAPRYLPLDPEVPLDGEERREGAGRSLGDVERETDSEPAL